MSKSSDDETEGGGYFRLLERIVVVYGLLIALAVGLGAFAWSRVADLVPTSGAQAATGLYRTPAPPVPSSVVEGAKARAWFGPAGGLTQGVVWAEGISRFSSQYTPTKWSANRAVGRPDVFPELSDHPEAWAPLEKDAGVEWIVLTWSPGLVARAVTIAETLNAGAVVRLDDVSDPDHPVTLWTDDSGLVVPTGKMLRVDLAAPRALRALRVVLDTSRVPGWNELDAVGLITEEIEEAAAALPRPPVRDFPAAAPGPSGATARAVDGVSRAYWATSVVRYSTTYSQSAWSPERALGAPDVWPSAGDNNHAWATKRADDGPEWITVRVPPTDATAIAIYETFNPGAIVRVDVIEDDGTAAVLWQGTSAAQGDKQILRIDLPEPRRLSVIRVVLDTRRVAGWNEIDAIAVLP